MRGRIFAALMLFTFSLALPGLALAEVFGAKPGNQKPLTVTEVLAAPSKFAGKPIVVEGIIIDVCSTRGCWMELGDGKSSKTLRIKVDDGVIVFPMSARGKMAKVEGKLEESSGEHHEGYEHKGSRKAEPRLIQLRATGAEIP